MNHPRVLFAGTPAFALASLRALVTSGTLPLAVLTQPDRPAGRGKKMSASPVKVFADEHEIPVLQPGTLRDEAVVAELEALEPDVLVVAAYGLILPQDVLDIPGRGCLNVHASLLPRWRGAAPVQAAILAGDAQTGISLMAMTAGLDCGPVYASAAIDIGTDETAGQLHDRLAALGGELLVDKFDSILAGDLESRPQDESLATYAGKIKTADARLDWQQPAEELARMVRAYNPVPGAWFMHGSERIKCWRATPLDGADAPPGTLLQAAERRIAVACADGALSLDELQRPGRRPVSGSQFAEQAARPGAVLE